VVLVVLGLFALLVQFTGFDAGQSWPLFVVIPGLTLLVVGYVSLGTGALIPGAILTIIGLILAYQSSTNDWTSWAFAWPLVAPGGVGLGLFLQGVRNHDSHLLRQGRVLMFVAAIIFMIGFVIFATIFRISDTDYGWFGKAALPALLIVVGLVLLARSIQRTRSA
jgi:cation transport ATPase